MTDIVLTKPTYRPTNGLLHVDDRCGRIGAIQRLPRRRTAKCRWVAYWCDPGSILYRLDTYDTKDAALAAVIDAHDHLED